MTYLTTTIHCCSMQESKFVHDPCSNITPHKSAIETVINIMTTHMSMTTVVKMKKMKLVLKNMGND